MMVVDLIWIIFILRHTEIVKAATKRQSKSEGELLDHANNNLLRALKREMLQKEGRVNSEKLRKDGYSERIIAKLENAWLHSFFRSRINSEIFKSRSGAARRARFNASEYGNPAEISRTIRSSLQPRAFAIWISAAKSV